MYAPVALVTVNVPYVPVRETVVPPSVPELIEYVRTSPASASVAPRSPLITENVSTAAVSVNVAVAGVGRTGALLMVIVTTDVAAAAGPVLPAASDAWLAANLGATVPVVEHVAVTVRVVAGVSDPGSKVHVAEPVLTKSASDTPVTASLKVSVKENDVELVGEVCVVVNDVTVGAVVSMTMALAPAMLFDPVGLVVEVIVLPAVSRTVPMVNDDTVRSAVVSVACTV